MHIGLIEVKRRGLKRVGLLGTRVVIQSHFYGVREGVEMVAPDDDLTEVHEAYVEMAADGVATAEHREVFMRAGMSLSRDHGCQSVLLAGTDFPLVFGKWIKPGFDTLDCAQAHATAIAEAAMTSQEAG